MTASLSQTMRGHDIRLQSTLTRRDKHAYPSECERWGGSDGIEGLNAHDLRHTWATCAARNGTPIDRLQDAGGWNSLCSTKLAARCRCGMWRRRRWRMRE